MTIIQNSDTLKEIRETTGANYMENKFPSVIPVIDVNPKKTKSINIAKRGSVNTSGAAVTLYTTPTDRDFFLTNVIIAFSSDVGCDATGSFDLVLYPADNPSINFQVPRATLTAVTNSLDMNFQQHPIRLARGSTIILTNPGYTAGIFRTNALIMGYVIENRQINYT